MESRVVANTDRLLDIFDESGVRATFFVLGWVGRALSRPGARDRRRAATRSPRTATGTGSSTTRRRDAFRDDVRRAKAAARRRRRRAACVGYRAPSYSITPRSLWALDVLIEEGYEYDSSIFPIRHDRYGIPVSPRRPYPIERRPARSSRCPGSTTRSGR